MAITYLEISSEAKRLLDEAGEDESRYRVSMSRAYYALYHAALGYADSVYTPSVSSLAGTTHEKIRNTLAEDLSPDKDIRLKRRRVGILLKSIHELRCQADYNNNDSIPLSVAQSCYSRVSNGLSTIEELYQLQKVS